MLFTVDTKMSTSLRCLKKQLRDYKSKSEVECDENRRLNFHQQLSLLSEMNATKPLIHTIPFTLAPYRPINRICVDDIGPINIDNQKIKHIFVVIDAFSGYIRLYSLESINSSEALKAFNSWIADFGCPSEIVSDNASYFVSELTKSFVDFSKIKHATIHHQLSLSLPPFNSSSYTEKVFKVLLYDAI